MHKLRKIDNIMFRVTDVMSAARFYEQQLGLKRLWADTERNMIGFGLSESEAEIVIHADPNIPNPDFSFLVDNVDEFCRDIKTAGFSVAMEPIDIRCGKFALLNDPDGNVIPLVDLTAFGGKPRYDTV